MSQWVFESYHAILGTQLHSALPFKSPAWTEIVKGNGSFTGKISVPQDPQALAQIKAATEKKIAAIAIRDRENSSWPWGGPILEREWNPDTGEITVTAIDWRTWFWWVFLGPLQDLSADRLYSWDQIDQMQIAKDIATFAAYGVTPDSPAGKPPLSFAPVAYSGILRDLHVQGLSFKRAGELLDTMSNRDRGFEWGITLQPNDTSNTPKPQFNAYYPEKGALIPTLLFKATPDGGNLIKYGPIKESGADQRERQWETGAGQPPDMVFAQDTSPDIAGILMREDVTSHSTVTERTTLASHARRERGFYEPGTQTLQVEVSLGNPDVSTYAAGDRGRLIIQDDWQDIDLPAVRILERKIMPDELKVQLTLDLADNTLPEVDSGGTV
jgi:hypothetical protein